MLSCGKCLEPDCRGFAGYTDPDCKEHGAAQASICPVCDGVDHHCRLPDRDPDIWEEWSDAEFLDYVESHSKTPLALFHISMVKRFFELASPQDMVVTQKHWLPLHFEHIEELLKIARERLNVGACSS